MIETKKNYINLDFNNFNITEVGDLKDMIDAQTDVNLNEDGLGGDIDI